MSFSLKAFSLSGYLYCELCDVRKYIFLKVNFVENCSAIREVDCSFVQYKFPLSEEDYTLSMYFLDISIRMRVLAVNYDV